MPLDLVGRLHRTVYIDGCAPAVRDDLLRLLVAKCGPIDGWDAVGERLVVIFQSVNSISTAVTFNGTAFGDLSARLLVWVATDTPPAGVAQQLAITATGLAAEATGAPAPGGAPRTAEEIKAAREMREKRLAAIRLELAPEIEEAESAASNETRRQDLCVRQMRALCILTAHAIEESGKSLEELTTHLRASQRLLKDLRKGKHQPSRNTPTIQVETGAAVALNATAVMPSLSEAIPQTTVSEQPSVLGERVSLVQRVEAMVAAAEDIGKRHVRSRNT